MTHLCEGKGREPTSVSWLLGSSEAPANCLGSHGCNESVLAIWLFLLGWEWGQLTGW